ncbi:hypothetical protein V5799_002568 [Amblyomma americanum]|uniref:FMN-dependent dehydrogenase domain-containing protein n=1 Tax=Amblyomma americanum TaxID=6943 RepID=A0AAQ4CWZ0_AMBAM
MAVSVMHSVPLQEVATAAGPDAVLWAQLDIRRKRSLTLDDALLAERCGFAALVVTLDAPLVGRKAAPGVTDPVSKAFAETLSCAMLQVWITPQAFLCHASSLDHASSKCFVATSFKDNLSLLPSWKAATWDGPAHVFSSTPTASMITDSTSYLSSVDIEPLCGHGEAFRMKPSEMFILLLQAFLCRASTLDHASTTTRDGPAHVFPSTPTAAMITGSASYSRSVDIELLCGHGEAFRMKPSETFILFLQAFLCHASTLDHASSFPVPCFKYGSRLKYVLCRYQLQRQSFAATCVESCHLERTCARVSFDAYCGNGYGQRQLLKLSRDRATLWARRSLQDETF